MKHYISKALLLPLATTALALSAHADDRADVTNPGDTIVLVNGANDGDGNSGTPPSGEIVDHAIDNVGQKYLNFLDLGSGFAVAPSMGSTVVTGIRLWTANDAVDRDPASFLLEGSSSLDGTWAFIAQGALSLPDGRNAGGSTPLTGSFFQEVSFDNAAGYAAYRLTFPTLKNAANANSMQIAEVELLGVPVPEPSTMAFIGLAALAGLTIKRRKA